MPECLFQPGVAGSIPAGRARLRPTDNRYGLEATFRARPSCMSPSSVVSGFSRTWRGLANDRLQLSAALPESRHRAAELFIRDVQVLLRLLDVGWLRISWIVRMYASDIRASGRRSCAERMGASMKNRSRSRSSALNRRTLRGRAALFLEDRCGCRRCFFLSSSASPMPPGLLSTSPRGYRISTSE